jgi:hypothetical protein
MVCPFEASVATKINTIFKGKREGKLSIESSDIRQDSVTISEKRVVVIRDRFGLGKIRVKTRWNKCASCESLIQDIYCVASSAFLPTISLLN